MAEEISEDSSYRGKLHFIVGKRVEADDGKVFVPCRRTVRSHGTHHEPAIGNVQELKPLRDEGRGVSTLVSHDWKRKSSEARIRARRRHRGRSNGRGVSLRRSCREKVGGDEEGEATPSVQQDGSGTFNPCWTSKVGFDWAGFDGGGRQGTTTTGPLLFPDRSPLPKRAPNDGKTGGSKDEGKLEFK